MEKSTKQNIRSRVFDHMEEIEAYNAWVKAAEWLRFTQTKIKKCRFDTIMPESLASEIQSIIRELNDLDYQFRGKGELEIIKGH